MKNRPISLLIVDDSPVACQLLSYIVQRDPQIRLAGIVSNGVEALAFLEKETPDAILMDINMPKMNGFEATRRIMRDRPVPIVICSGEFQQSDVMMSFKAIEAGALAILEKPVGLNSPGFEAMVAKYLDTIKTVSEVKLITRMAGKASGAAPATPRDLLIEKERLKNVQAVGIGASLGGPQALMTLLSALKHPFPVPIFIVQHITPGFTEGFASWLSSETAIPVKIAASLEVAKPNTIYIAPSEMQMEVHAGGVIRLLCDTPGPLLNPSVSRLFKSMAATYREKAVGAILTGMGRDGVNELLQMKAQGAVTVAQSSRGCLMFGMPREAISIGAATHVLDLEEIAPFLNLINGQRT